ncbi:MAG: type II toxin-antitoxin system RelE/ParE family toxin [Deltaproteobacteria bacterium]|nr:type II toxin-antitoxin system RelE/ParE family toxin [Deltaproteobacteria bacterium]
MFQVAHYYAEQKLHLGEQFLDAIDSVLEFLVRNPKIGSKEKLNTRKWSLKRFPYKVIYAFDDKELVVAAIMHQSRNPDYWLGRLKF